MNILIAEDSTIIQMMHRQRMKEWGYEVDIASDGAEAVEYALKNDGKYDFCLMDVEMPRLNGIEATKIIRKTARYFPILGYTSEKDYEQQCFEAGMDDFAIKPCPPEDLLARIRKLTIKLYKLISKPNAWEITEETPVDKQHAEELKKLKSQGLVKMRLDGPADNEVIAHENTPNKISYDFNIKRQLMTEFLNRDPERPTVCDLYRGEKNCIVETFVAEDDYQAMLNSEDEMMGAFKEKFYRADDE